MTRRGWCLWLLVVSFVFSYFQKFQFCSFLLSVVRAVSSSLLRFLFLIPVFIFVAVGCQGFLVWVPSVVTVRPSRSATCTSEMCVHFCVRMLGYRTRYISIELPLFRYVFLLFCLVHHLSFNVRPHPPLAVHELLETDSLHYGDRKCTNKLTSGTARVLLSSNINFVSCVLAMCQYTEWLLLSVWELPMSECILVWQFLTLFIPKYFP